MNTKQIALRIFFAMLAGILIVGCDVGVNPLLFDGSPLSAKFRVDESSKSSFDDSTTINVAEVLSSVDKDIDSIKVFNITLQIDSLTDGTQGTTKLSGTAMIDGHILFTILDPGVELSAFASERSIFDETISGGPIFRADGVAHLISRLHSLHSSSPPASVTVRVSGSASSSTLHFTVKLKLYTQIYTTP